MRGRGLEPECGNMKGSGQTKAQLHAQKRISPKSDISRGMRPLLSWDFAHMQSCRHRRSNRPNLVTPYLKDSDYSRLSYYPRSRDTNAEGGEALGRLGMDCVAQPEHARASCPGHIALRESMRGPTSTCTPNVRMNEVAARGAETDRDESRRDCMQIDDAHPWMT